MPRPSMAAASVARIFSAVNSPTDSDSSIVILLHSPRGSAPLTATAMA